MFWGYHHLSKHPYSFRIVSIHVSSRFPSQVLCSAVQELPQDLPPEVLAGWGDEIDGWNMEL